MSRDEVKEIRRSAAEDVCWQLQKISKAVGPFETDMKSWKELDRLLEIWLSWVPKNEGGKW